MSVQWDEARLRRETIAALQALAELSRSTIKSAEIEMITPADRAEASARAFEYRRKAAQIIDPIAADGYRQLAKKALQEAGLA